MNESYYCLRLPKPMNGSSCKQSCSLDSTKYKTQLLMHVRQKTAIPRLCALCLGREDKDPVTSHKLRHIHDLKHIPILRSSEENSGTRVSVGARKLG